MRKTGLEKEKALAMVIIALIVLMFIVWNAKGLFLHPKKVPQVAVAVVDYGKETITLTGPFEVVNITLVENDIVITLVNTECEECGFYTTRRYPTGVHYEIGQVVNAELIFRYNEYPMYKLLSLKIK